MKITYLLLLPIYLLTEILPLIAGALISGAASLAGNAISANSAKKANEQNVALARETNQFNAVEAQKQRDYQTQMSNTAHQREVSDLMAAGLNPILSATGGNGASTPSGASASGVLARVDPTVKNNIGDDAVQSVYAAKRFAEIEKRTANENIDLMRTAQAKNRADQAVSEESVNQIKENLKTQQSQQALNSASAQRELANADLANTQKLLVIEDIANRKAQTQLNSAQTVKVKADTGLSQAQTTRTKADTGLVNASTGKTKAETTKTKYDTSKSKRESQMYESKAGKAIPWIDKVLNWFRR